MGFIVRMYEATSDRMVLVGRAPSATDAFALLRRWRTDHPGSWVAVEALAYPHRPEAA